MYRGRNRGRGLGLGLMGARQVANNAFNPAAMNYDASKSLDVSSAGSSISGLHISPTAQVLISEIDTDDIYRFDGGSFDDISGAALNGTVTDPLSNNPYGLLYTPDGDVMSIVQSSTAIEGYDASTAFSPITNSYNGTLRVDLTGTGITFARSQDFSADGSVLVVVGAGTKTIRAYDLSTPYDTSTASRNAAKDLDVSGVVGGTADIASVLFVQNGIQVIGRGTAVLHHFDLTDDNDPSTGTENAAKELDLSGVDNVPSEHFWSPHDRDWETA